MALETAPAVTAQRKLVAGVSLAAPTRSWKETQSSQEIELLNLTLTRGITGRLYDAGGYHGLRRLSNAESGIWDSIKPYMACEIYAMIRA